MNILDKSINWFKSKTKSNKVSNQSSIIILPKYQALYFPIPKVASSTWLRICAILLKIEIPPMALQKNRRVEGIPTISRTEVVKYDNYFKFAFVRNPYDRLISCYHNKITQDANLNTPYFKNGVEKSLANFDSFTAGMSFEEFVIAIANIPDSIADKHFKSQYTFLVDAQEKIIVDFIGQLECADQDFLYVLERLERTDISIPHFKKSKEKKQYKQYYNSKMKKLVEKRYAKDIEIFKYYF